MPQPIEISKATILEQNITEEGIEALSGKLPEELAAQVFLREMFGVSRVYGVGFLTDHYLLGLHRTSLRILADLPSEAVWTSEVVDYISKKIRLIPNSRGGISLIHYLFVQATAENYEEVKQSSIRAWRDNPLIDGGVLFNFKRA